MELSSPKLKNSFFGENLLGFFIIVSSGVFIFHRWFLPLFFECFHCWLHFFMSPTLLLFCQVLRSCVVPWVLRIWEGFFFLLSGFFYLKPFPHICHSTASATDLRELFLLSGVFTLHTFPTFGTICFYHGFPGSWQFFLEGCRASSHWGSKHRTSLSVCLNHTVFSKRY